MGVYIKGMEMPATCCHCPLMGYDPDREWVDSMARTGAHICVLTGELIDNTKREEHCPLVPVPPHGRLIDADELTALVYANIALFDSSPRRMGAEQKLVRAWLASMVDDIEDAPTILEAEEGE